MECAHLVVLTKVDMINNIEASVGITMCLQKKKKGLSIIGWLAWKLLTGVLIKLKFEI